MKENLGVLLLFRDIKLMHEIKFCYFVIKYENKFWYIIIIWRHKINV